MKKFFTFIFAMMAAVSINADDALYLVGDGTPIGWEGDVNQRQSTRMREISTGVYEWTGLLKHGGEGFKIQEGTSSWDVRYCPSSANYAITQEGGTDTYQSKDDWKWNPSNEDWQWYTITVDKNNGTLSWQAANPTLLVADGDGYFNIGTPEELNTLAFMCRNNVNNDNYKVRLTADIDYTTYRNGSLDAIGITELHAPFRGEFDGQNHTITVDLTSYSTRFSFFGTIVGQVHNLKLAGKITATNKNQTAGFCGLLKGDGSKIHNCISAIEVVDSQEGDGTIGGFCAVTYNASIIENSAFYGKINAPNRDGNGGIVGWANSGASTTIKNCLIVADINWKAGEDFGRNNPSVLNTYKTTASDETLANGQMTYQLNSHVSGAEDWFQTLGSDLMPTPLSSSAKLYANGTFNCDGVTPKEGVEIVLSNENASIVEDHAFGANGVCSGCKAVGQEAALVDGKYQINNEGNLIWWSAYVNAGHTDVNAVLNADLDMTGTVYTPIGTPENVYAGSFYGQNHSVTFALENSPYNYQGLFGIITDGVWIERVIVKGFIKGNSYVGGIVGGTNGGSENAKKTNIWHCGNEATITASEANAAGIIGVNMSGSASIILTNCYNTGDITSGREAGALSGWLGGGWSSVRNCYNSGTVKNGGNVSKAFGRNNGCYFTNCYYTATSGTDNSTEDTQNGTPAQVADAAMASGELCVKLGEDFYQLLGTDAYPVPFNSHAKVSYVGDAGYATMYDTTTGYTLNGDVKAYVATTNNTWLELTEIENVPASTPVVLKGSYYNKFAQDLPAINIANELKGTDADTDADGTMYILAKVDDKVGFYKATGTIPAGKAYYQSTSSVKAFYFDGDDATGIEMVNGQFSMDNGQPIYNLAGQRIQKMQKGINIVNGKKVLY